MSGLTAGPALDPLQAAQLARRAMFECCKWDPQVFDLPTVAPFPLWITPEEWAALATDAETLAAEAISAERALLDRPELWRVLGIPRAIRSALSGRRWPWNPRAAPAVSAARFMRFDFHPTTDGWRISEVNCDVPGGFVEASGVTQLMAEACGAKPVGDPAAAVVNALLPHAAAGPIALVHATAYSDDRQVMELFARMLRERGATAAPCGPDALVMGSDASFSLNARRVGALLRFFPAEWLPNLSGVSWRGFFAGSRTPQANPGAALLVQSKRFPLVWDALGVSLPSWRRLLPETRDPRDVEDTELDGDRFIAKPALGRVGDGIALRGAVPDKDLRSWLRAARRHPSHWVAQRRFVTATVKGPDGVDYTPCVGVFTVDGKVAGAYTRIARTAVVDQRAQDAALLFNPESIANRRRA